ncbi:MAG: DUF4013 domain-containing protein, partial [Chloroflexales bacterium]
DEQWLTSILVAGLITILFFVPIVNIFAILILMGYMLETARNVAAGNPRPLPKWNDIGTKLSLGFSSFLIGLVYMLPLLILSLLFVCIAAGLGGASARNENALVAVLGGSFFCFLPLVILAGLALQPLVLAATARYLQTGSLGAAFRVGEVFSLVRADMAGWLILFLLYLLCSVVASAGSMIVIGFLFTYPYSQAVFGHLLGQKLIQLNQPTGYGTGYSPPPASML